MGWRDELKVGDTVIIGGGGWRTEDKITKVHRLTNSQIVVLQTNGMGMSYEVKYWKDNGWSVGQNSHSRTWLSEPDEEKIQQIRLNQSRHKLSKQFDRLSKDCEKWDQEKLTKALDFFKDLLS